MRRVRRVTVQQMNLHLADTLLTQHGINKEDITDAIIATVVPDNLINLKTFAASTSRPMR